MSEPDITAKYKQMLAYVQSNMGSDWTQNSQLDKMGHSLLSTYQGSFPYDVAPELQNEQSCIINLDKSGNKGIHWMALYKEDGTVYGYDSFGRRMNKLMPLEQHVTNDTKDKEQKDSQNNCGQRAIAWLRCVEKYGIENALNI